MSLGFKNLVVFESQLFFLGNTHEASPIIILNATPFCLIACARPLLWYAGSLAGACELLAMACGSISQTRDRTRASCTGSAVLAAGPPGKSSQDSF